MTKQRPASNEYLDYYGAYIALVPEGDIVEILRAQIGETLDVLRSVSPERSIFRYAEGKWSVNELVGHVSDAERIFAYRALRIARNDKTPLPGFDENEYARNGAFDAMALPNLVSELESVRHATLGLLTNLQPDAWARTGSANGAPVSVRALAYITAGHEIHHRAILRDRYLR